MNQPLVGLKVLEVGNIIAGPFCGTMLADFGAEVIKVESPKNGDFIRKMGLFEDLWFCVEGRNKKNITLNLKKEEGKEILWDLIRKADILIENFRPGAFEKLGFTWEKLHKVNPRLIYVVSSTFGQSGPKAKEPGLDRIGLATGGFLQVTGYPDRAPVKPGISTADFYCALFALAGTMFAVYNRDVVGTGEGQVVDSSLSEVMLRLQESIIAEYSYKGLIRERIGNASDVTSPSGHFRTKDGEYFVLTLTGDKLFKQCMTIIGREDLIVDPRFATGIDRIRNRDEMNSIMSDWIEDRTLKECIDTFEGKVPCSKIYNAKDIVEDTHFNARNMIIDVDTEKFGHIKMQNVVPKLSGSPGHVNWAGKSLGAFNEEVYGKELGFSTEKIKELTEQGVI